MRLSTVLFFDFLRALSVPGGNLNHATRLRPDGSRPRGHRGEPCHAPEWRWRAFPAIGVNFRRPVMANDQADFTPHASRGGARHRTVGAFRLRPNRRELFLCGNQRGLTPLITWGR